MRDSTTILDALRSHLKSANVPGTRRALLELQDAVYSLPLGADETRAMDTPATRRVAALGIACALLGLMLAAGCSTDGGWPPPGGTRHPQAQYLHRPDGVPVNRISTEPNVGGPHQRLVESLATASPIASIGTLDGPLPYVFGVVEDAHMDADGRLLVLDSRFNDVRLYTREGNYAGRLGGPGVGPQRLVRPTSLSVDENLAEAYVTEWNYEVEVYDVAADRLRPSRTLRTTVSQRSSCVLDGRLLVNAWAPTPDVVMRADARALTASLPSAGEAIIHQFDRAGLLHGSFGSNYLAPSHRVNSTLAEGRLACDPDTRRVLFASRGLLGELRGYSPDGDLHWITIFDEFVPTEYFERTGSIAVRVPAEGFHRLEALTYLGGGYALYQLGLVQRDGHSIVEYPPEVRELHSYVVDSKSGKGLYAGNSLPRIVAANHGHFVGVVEDSDQGIPYPTIVIYEYQMNPTNDS